MSQNYNESFFYLLSAEIVLTNVSNSIYEQLEYQLEDILSEHENVLSQYEQCIKICLNAISELKKLVHQHAFTDKEEEIFFFKRIKPKFSSKLIYYTRVLNIEIKRPIGSEVCEKSYLIKQLDRLKDFFDNNIVFYEYHRFGATHLDEKYFLRGHVEIIPGFDYHIYDCDQTFSTSHDQKVAEILANDQLKIFLDKSLIALENHQIPRPYTSSSKLRWTLSKAACIELVYALQSIGAFNDGMADIKLIADSLEAAFNIDLKNYYRSFLEIRQRKTNRTTFIDQLKERLMQRMDDWDENIRPLGKA